MLDSVINMVLNRPKHFVWVGNNPLYFSPLKHIGLKCIILVIPTDKKLCIFLSIIWSFGFLSSSVEISQRYWKLCLKPNIVIMYFLPKIQKVVVANYSLTRKIILIKIVTINVVLTLLTLHGENEQMPLSKNNSAFCLIFQTN